MRTTLVSTIAAGVVALGMGLGQAVSVSVPLVVTPQNATLLGFTQTSYNCAGSLEPNTGSQAWSLSRDTLTAPLQLVAGAYRMTVGPVAGSVQTLSQSLFAGSPVRDVDLRYFSFAESGAVAPLMTLLIDVNGDASADRSLVFDPRRNAGAQGSVVPRAWQEWNAGEGLWFDASAPSTTFLLSSLPANARIVNGIGAGGIGITVGCGPEWAGFAGYVDGLTISTSRVTVADEPIGAGGTFNFELGEADDLAEFLSTLPEQL